MKNKEEFYTLEVTPISENTAVLTNISVTDKNSVFAKVGVYGGKVHHITPNSIEIELGVHNDKIYTIVGIKATAFSQWLNLKTIKIGKNVEKIDWNMYKCVSLENIFVDKDNQVFHDIDGVLFHKKELIAFPQGRTGAYIIPEGTKKIGKHAFKSCHLSNVIFPNTLEEIGQNAFYECKNIKEFILPESIKRVHFNDDIGHNPIKQKFYLSSDVTKSNPLNILQIRELFPV